MTVLEALQSDHLAKLIAANDQQIAARMDHLVECSLDFPETVDQMFRGVKELTSDLASHEDHNPTAWLAALAITIGTLEIFSRLRTTLEERQ